MQRKRTSEAWTLMIRSFAMRKKFLAALTVAGALIFAAPGMQANAEWRITSSGRQYTIDEAPGYAVGWKTIGNYTYYFDKNGYAVTGWQTIGGKEYYFDVKGRMITKKWVQNKYLGSKGYVIKTRTTTSTESGSDTATSSASASSSKTTGWVESDGKYYYYKKGKKQYGWLTLNGKKYYLNKKTGERKTGLSKIGSKYYLFDTETGERLTGWVTYKGKKYFFSRKNGAALTGWSTINRKYYYFTRYGKLRTNMWIDEVYYVDGNGRRVYGWQTIEGKKYYFDTNTGVRVAGWQTIDGKKYYFNADGSLQQQTGAVTIDSKRYYIDGETGEQKTGLITINGKLYYYDPETGEGKTGWIQIDGKYYYFGKNFYAKRKAWVDGCYLGNDRTRQYGWLTLKTKTYYLDEKTGVRVTGWQTIDGESYYFNSKGVMQVSQWIKDKYVDATGKVTKTRNTGLYTDENGNKYYLDKNYEPKTGWILIGGYKYYFGTDGKMVTNDWVDSYYVGSNGRRVKKQFIKVDGKTYYMKSDGKKKTGWLTLDGKKYYFNRKGEQIFGLKKLNSYTYYFDSNNKGAMLVSTTKKVNGVTYIIDSKGHAIKKTSNSSTLGDKLADYAQEFIGNQYVYGGTWDGEDPYTPTDCSGFVQGVMAHFGISIPRVAADQATGTDSWSSSGTYATATEVEIEDLMPGDLIFYYTPISHVAMYIGNGMIVHASNSQPYPVGGVKTSIYDYSTIVKCVRYW